MKIKLIDWYLQTAMLRNLILKGKYYTQVKKNAHNLNLPFLSANNLRRTSKD